MPDVEHRGDWVQRALSAEAQVERLRAALERYGYHESGCPMLDRQREDVCYCGLDRAKAR